MNNWIEKSEMIAMLQDMHELPRIDHDLHLIKIGKIEEGLDNLVKKKYFEIKKDDYGLTYYRVNLDFLFDYM